MNEPAPSPTPFIELSPDDPAGSVVVELDSFVEFALQLDLDLEALVEKYSHLATPLSLRAWRR